jgi:hypothetical protein
MNTEKLSYIRINNPCFLSFENYSYYSHISRFSLTKSWYMFCSWLTSGRKKDLRECTNVYCPVTKKNKCCIMAGLCDIWVHTLKKSFWYKHSLNSWTALKSDLLPFVECEFPLTSGSMEIRIIILQDSWQVMLAFLPWENIGLTIGYYWGSTGSCYFNSDLRQYWSVEFQFRII